MRIVDRLLDSEPDPADIINRSISLLPTDGFGGGWTVRFPDSKFPYAVLTVFMRDDHAEIWLQNRDGSHNSWERRVMFKDVSPVKFAKFIRRFAKTYIPSILDRFEGDWYGAEHILDMTLAAGLGVDIYLTGVQGWERV
ncbi:MAG: hypothetical protein ACYSUV_00305 [Planctomycetota bacterium]